MTPEERKSTLAKYYLCKLANFIFRLLVPVIIAGIVWGFFQVAPDYEDAIVGTLISATEFQVEGVPVEPDEETYYRDELTDTVYMYYKGNYVLAELQRPSFASRLTAGVFVILLVFGTEIKDRISAFLAEMKLKKRWVFLKNRSVSYLLAGCILLFAYLIAKDAMIFCFGSGASCIVAFGFETAQKHLHDKLWPPQVVIQP